MLLIAKQSCQYVEVGIETTQKERSEVEIDHLLSICIDWVVDKGFNRQGL
jgi:hypothetical protein